jgi:hypothetical protein
MGNQELVNRCGSAFCRSRNEKIREAVGLSIKLGGQHWDCKVRAVNPGFAIKFSTFANLVQPLPQCW